MRRNIHSVGETYAKMLFGNLNVKTRLEHSKSRQQHNIKMGFKWSVSGVDWTHLAQDRVHVGSLMSRELLSLCLKNINK